MLSLRHEVRPSRFVRRIEGCFQDNFLMLHGLRKGRGGDERRDGGEKWIRRPKLNRDLTETQPKLYRDFTDSLSALPQTYPSPTLLLCYRVRLEAHKAIGLCASCRDNFLFLLIR